jgi:hypothetical protein
MDKLENLIHHAEVLINRLEALIPKTDTSDEK